MAIFIMRDELTSFVNKVCILAIKVTMRITKLYLLLVCLCCFSISTLAQTNFLPGYYVDDLGDTTRGFIEYRSREMMSHFIRYKKRENSMPRRLNPENITMVSINDQNVYRSFTYTPHNGEPFAGFFKEIITGRITLYRYRNRYFVFKTGDKLREITKATKRVTVELIGDDYSGMGVLRSLITDCSTIDEQFLLDNYVGKVDYRKIVNKYNSCFSEGTNERQDIVIKSHLDFGIQGNVNWGKPDFSLTESMSDAKFGWAKTVGGGFLVSLFTHQMGDRIRFNVEPSIGYYAGYSNFQNDDGVNDVRLRYTFLRMPAYFRCYIRGGFFVDLGLTNLAVINQQSYWRIEYYKYNNNYLFTSNGPQYSVKSAAIAGLAGIGGKFEIGGMPVFVTARASSIFRPFRDLTATQPVIQWVDLGLALQLIRK